MVERFGRSGATAEHPDVDGQIRPAEGPEGPRSVAAHERIRLVSEGGRERLDEVAVAGVPENDGGVPQEATPLRSLKRR